MHNPQNDDAWLAKRRGHITASRIGLIARRKRNGEPYAGYDDYLMEVLTERLTGRTTERFVTAAMQWGIEQEAFAADLYQFETGIDLATSDYVVHPEISMSGASPDRLIGSDGLLEIKCPNTRTHVDFLLTGEIDENYIWQMVWQMECTGRAWCDFMSYDPRLPVHLQSKTVRVHRDAEKTEIARQAVTEALATIENLQAKLEALT